MAAFSVSWELSYGVSDGREEISRGKPLEQVSRDKGEAGLCQNRIDGVAGHQEEARGTPGGLDLWPREEPLAGFWRKHGLVDKDDIDSVLIEQGQRSGP